METYVLLIKNETVNGTGANLEQIEEYLKTEFKSYDYMVGFCDGYLFDNYCIIDLKEYENKIRICSDSLKNKYIKFVTVTNEDK